MSIKVVVKRVAPIPIQKQWSASRFSARPLPSSCQRTVWVEVQVMDTFTVTLLMQNFFLDL